MIRRRTLVLTAICDTVLSVPTVSVAANVDDALAVVRNNRIIEARDTQKKRIR